MSSVPALQRICEACTGVQVDPRSSAAHRMCVKPGLALGSGVSLGSEGSDSVAQFACNLHNAMFLNVQSLPPLTHSPQMRKDSLKAYGLNNTLNKMQDNGWWSEVSTYWNHIVVRSSVTKSLPHHNFLYVQIKTQSARDTDIHLEYMNHRCTHDICNAWAIGPGKDQNQNLGVGSLYGMVSCPFFRETTTRAVAISGDPVKRERESSVCSVSLQLFAALTLAEMPRATCEAIVRSSNIPGQPETEKISP